MNRVTFNFNEGDRAFRSEQQMQALSSQVSAFSRGNYGWNEVQMRLRFPDDQLT